MLLTRRAQKLKIRYMNFLVHVCFIFRTKRTRVIKKILMKTLLYNKFANYKICTDQN